MSKFRVGQRVRIKWSRAWPWLAGMTGTIIAKVDRGEPGDPECEWQVLPDGYASNRFPSPNSPTGYSRFAPSSSQLEPATDSYDVVSWDTCVWKPEHLRVGA